MDGYKTYIGAAFIALTVLLTGLEPILAPDVLLVAKAITGAIGAFLTAVGMIHKYEKKQISK